MAVTGTAGRRQWTDWTGAGIILAYALVQWIYLDVQTLGPDQMRDIAIARDVAEGHALPLVGPVFRGSVHLGPAYYYLSAIGYAMGGVNGISGFNLLLSTLMILAAWRILHRHVDSVVARGFAALSLPGYLLLYAASPWAPALTFPTACLALCLWLAIRSGHQPSLAWALPTLALAVQIHPSAGLLVIPYLSLLRQPGRLFNRHLGIGLGMSLLVVAPWAVGMVQRGLGDLLSLLSVTDLGSTGGIPYLQRLWGLIGLGPSALSSIEPFPMLAASLGWAYWTLLGFGLILALSRRRHWPEAGVTALAWSWLAIVGVMVLSIGFGTLWYLDVPSAGLIVLAAFGLSCLSPRWRTAMIVVAVVVTATQTMSLKGAWRQQGLIEPSLAGITYPKQDPLKAIRWPFVSLKVHRSYLDWLGHQGLQPGQVGGEAAMALRELAARTPPYQPGASSSAAESRHWMSWPGFGAPPNGDPVWQEGEFRLYRSKVAVSGPVQVHPAQPDGFDTGFSPPAALPPTLIYQVRGQATEFWVALRCVRAYQDFLETLPLEQDGRPRLPSSVVHRTMYMEHYYRVRWPVKGDSDIRLNLDEPLDCDLNVSAF